MALRITSVTGDNITETCVRLKANNTESRRRGHSLRRHRQAVGALVTSVPLTIRVFVCWQDDVAAIVATSVLL